MKTAINTKGRGVEFFKNANIIIDKEKQWVKTKDQRQTITGVREDVQRLEPSYVAGDMQHGTAALENSLAVPQILNAELPCDSTIHFLHV